MNSFILIEYTALLTSYKQSIYNLNKIDVLDKMSIYKVLSTLACRLSQKLGKARHVGASIEDRRHHLKLNNSQVHNGPTVPGVKL